MKTLKLTPGGDLDVTDNTFNLIQENDEFDQRVKSLLSIKKGEWFLNDELGLSHDNIIGKAFDESKIELDLIEAVKQDSRVVLVGNINITFDRQARTTTINFDYTDVDGTVTEGEVII